VGDSTFLEANNYCINITRFEDSFQNKVTQKQSMKAREGGTYSGETEFTGKSERVEEKSCTPLKYSECRRYVTPV